MAEQLLQVERVERDEFFAECWEYNAGEHVSFLGPTGAGKTELAFDLLRRTATKEVPAVVMAMKPRDLTVAKFQRATKWRRVRYWPPPPSIWQPGKQPGYILWPPHTSDPEGDEMRHERIFHQCLRDSYVKGDRIVFADETYSLTHEMGLERDLVRIWSKGRSMGCGLWAATQKPTHVPLWMYNQAEHLFLAFDPDERAQDRFSEIGGVDPRLVKRQVIGLRRWEWLYIRRRDRSMCVVGA